AVEHGIKVRERQKALEESTGIQEKGIDATRKANKLRDAAHGVDEVLSSLVAKVGSALRVEGGRLYTETKRGKKTPFAELSEGERFKVAIDIGVDAFKAVPEREPMLFIEDAGWVAIDPINQAAIHKHAQARGAVILV